MLRKNIILLAWHAMNQKQQIFKTFKSSLYIFINSYNNMMLFLSRIRINEISARKLLHKNIKRICEQHVSSMAQFLQIDTNYFETAIDKVSRWSEIFAFWASFFSFFYENVYMSGLFSGNDSVINYNMEKTSAKFR